MAPFGRNPKSVGLWQYARHPTTSVWCFAYRFDKEPVEMWWRDQPLPERVVQHVARKLPLSFVAHNAPFELDIWNEALNKQVGGGLPRLEIEQMDCTMARCKALSLPPDLERAAEAVDAPVKKNISGSKTMELMAAPAKTTWLDPGSAAAPIELIYPISDSLDRSNYGRIDRPDLGIVLRIEWHYNEELRQKQSAYCIDDVLAECGIDDVVSPLSDWCLKLWRWNERVNARGIPFDRNLINRIEEAVTSGKASANRRMWTFTNGAVKKCTEHAVLATWLDKRGIRAPIINKHGEEVVTVAKGATDDLIAAAEGLNDSDAVKAIRLHAASSKSSTSKMTKAKQLMASDDHVRGVFSFHSAAPGRFSAYGYQAHNLVRVDEDAELPTVRQVVDILEKYPPPTAYEAIDIIYGGEAMHWMSKCTRATIKAPAGKIFRGVDLSNIQGRLNAWVAGETWKVDAFKAYDEGRGPELYRVTAGELLNIKPEEVTKLQRQAQGKVPDLAGGFQGSVAAYVQMGLNYGTRPETIASVAAETTDPRVWALVAKGYRQRYSVGLEQSVWTGIKVVVNNWRQKHPKIVQSWWDRQDAVIEAVSNPGQMVPCCEGRVRYLVQHGFLWSMLASGRLIAYPSPSIISVPYLRERIEVIDGVEVIVEEEAYKNAVQVFGMVTTASGGKVWGGYTLFGGILCQNDVMGMEVNIMFDGAMRATDAGYDVCFHCHDEILTVCDPAFGSRKELEGLLTVPAAYAPGLPLAAKAWSDIRYVK